MLLMMMMLLLLLLIVLPARLREEVTQFFIFK